MNPSASTPTTISSEPTPPSVWLEKLRSILAEFQCVTGTLHLVHPATGLLELQAQEGIPPFLLDKISIIPFGKGIAGCAAEQQEAVQMCNLQQDTSGIARPEALKTKVAGALAVPLLDPASGQSRGVLGIGKQEPYEFTQAEIASLEAHAAAFALALSTASTSV